MNKLIIGLILGIVVSAPILAKNVINPLDWVYESSSFDIATTKITTDEGTYRIFIGTGRTPYGKGVGITAIKIK